MGAEYTTVMLPDGKNYKSFGWRHPQDSNHVDYYAMSNWHTELVKSVGIDPGTGRKTVYTYAPSGQHYIDPSTGEITDKVVATIGEYDFVTAAEYHQLEPGDVVVVEHNGKIWRVSDIVDGSPRNGIEHRGRGRTIMCATPLS